MDPNRLTEKAQELAQQHGQQQIDAEHLAAALLGQDGGVAHRVVEKAGGNPKALLQRLQQAIERLPRVSGSGATGGQVYISARANEVFTSAEAEAQLMKDELGITPGPDSASSTRGAREPSARPRLSAPVESFSPHAAAPDAGGRRENPSSTGSLCRR